MVSLYQNVNISLNMYLRNKLISIHRHDANVLASYLMKITELRDQWDAIWVKVEDEELVSIALNIFSMISFPPMRIFRMTLHEKKQC